MFGIILNGWNTSEMFSIFLRKKFHLKILIEKPTELVKEDADKFIRLFLLADSFHVGSQDFIDDSVFRGVCLLIKNVRRISVKVEIVAGGIVLCPVDWVDEVDYFLIKVLVSVLPLLSVIFMK